MGKIKKSPTERHNATASPAITQYIESATAVPLHELPAKLNSFALHWPFPRGDLYHWIPLLDRFDHILEISNKEYGLNLGPQTQPFARRVLEKGDAEEGKPQPADGAQEKELDAAGFGHDGDRELVENILRFTRVLLERCGNRSLYASSGHINDLLHTTSLDLLQACLQVSLKLAQRYQVARAKNSHPAAQSTLLANHYNISLDSMHRLASPLPRPRIIASSSTPSSAKVKEKASAGPAYNPTDLVALAKDTYSPLARKELAAVSFTYVAKKLLKQEDNQHDDEAFARDPASPTTSRHSRPGTEEVLETVVKPRDSYFPIPTQATFDLSASEVAEKDIHVLVQEHIQQVPKVAQYDLLHRLRVAKTFATHASTRQLLDIRLLAISNLAYALEGNKFQELIGQPDTEEPRRYHLAPQLCDLLQPSSDGQSSLPIKAETTVLETLEALARCRHKNAEVTDALAVTVNHGVLYYELRRAVASLKTDPDVVDAEVLSKIQWRSAIFDLITTISQFSHQIRCAEKMVSAGIMEILVDALRIQSASAERVYDKVIGFISSFTHGIAAAFPALTTARGFEAITQLASQQVTKSLTYVKEANGAVNDLKSKVVDYSIPYHQQATLRSIFKFIIYLFENSSGTHDRLLRNLLDSPQTLGALQQIIANADIFGSNVWDAAIHTVSDFIHNEPTSFQVIAEAGLARGILEAVTQRTISSSDPAPIVDSDHITVINGQIQLPEAKGILPASETIVNIPNAFGAICLNEDGMNLFQSSGALDAYFDVFLSPNHVKALEEESGTAFTIGNTFDELSRHHPGLQEQILTAVIRMLKRVRSLGELLAPLSSSVLYPLSLKFQKEDEAMAGDASTLSNRANHREIFNRAPATPYISACFKFLEGFFHNSTMCQKFCRKGAAEVVVDLITSPANPYDMNVFPMIAKMATVVSRMCEEKPHLVVPSVVQRTNLNLNTLKDLISSSGESSYFKGFVAESTDVQLDGGRDLARAMVNVSVLSSILAKVFTTPAFTARNASTTHLLQSLTFADVYANLVDQLGKLHGACVWESLALTQRIPELWKPFTSSELLHVRNVDSNGAIHITHNCAHCKFDGMAERDDLITNLDDNLRLFAFKNMRMLRFVLNQVPLHIESFFQSLAVALPPKRNTDHQQKQHAALVAEHLAQALVDGLRYRKFLEFSQLDHLRYVNMVLSAVAKILLRTASSLENIAIKEAVTLVLLKFVDAGGLERINDCLQLAGDIVRKTPSDSPDEEAKASEEGAQEVLATILGFYSHITRNKCITDSANLSALVNRRSDNADYFVPSQFLVEIRYKVLASVFPLWSSDAMSKLRANSVKLVIETLQNILKGDNEDRALKRSDNAVKKVHGSSGFKCHNPTNFGKVSEGITDRDLAWEAIVRCNNNDTNALEYCRLHLENGDMPRFPLPAGACDLETSTQPVTSDDTAEPSITAGGSSSAEPVSTSREVDGSDQTMSDDENYGSLGPLPDDVARQDLAVMGGVAGLMQLAMLNENTLPDGAQTAGAEVVAEEPFLTVDDLEEEREKVRVDLIDKCLDVLSATPTVTFALSDLIQAAVARTGESANPRAEIGKTLVSSLMSLQEDDADAETGAKISAYAHLVALILQDRDFFDSTLDELKEYFESLISWIELRNDQKAENKPWIETILLIMERVLAEDEQPAAIEWTPPPADNPLGKPIELVGTVAAPIVPKELRRKLFAAIFNIVPKIGKDQSLALSISRVLVILTRDHQLAAQTRDKQCMSRLFLMVRQLGRALGDKLQTSILIILRHCIEDADSIRQTIRVEIKTAFESSRSGSRGMDLNSYIRNLSHLVLRNPHIFAEVTQELVEIHGFNGNTHKSQHLALKRQVAPTTENDSAVPVGDVVSPSKTSDVRPIVESSDGVIQFLLRELSNYKEVEDKLPSLKLNIEAESNKAQEISASNEGASSQTENKSERQSFKPDEHVIYIYRCFIMQCLAELVACYSHTKTEFINFSRRGEAQVSTPSKPRSGTINYLLNQLLPVGTLEHRDDIAHRKKVATSDWATTVLVALCSQTHEKPYYERHPSPDSLIEREDPDLAFVRRFVLEHAIKSFKDALASTEPQEMRYSRLLAFADLFERLLNAKPDRENPVPTAIFARSSLQVGRLMYEKNFIATLTASIAELDLNYPNAKRVVKHILGPIKTLTDLAVELSQRGEISSSGPGSSTDDEDISSATSVSGQQDSDEEREQTPDLFRNSALSMFESSAGHDDDSESSDEEDEDDDQEMFDAGFEEEVDFEDGNGETISDEDEDLDGMEGVGDEEGDVHYDVEIIDENDEDADESDDEHGDEDDDGEDDDMDGDDDQDMDDEDDDDADDHEEYLQNMEEITGDNENASHDGLDGHIWQEHDDEDEELPRILSPPILHHRPLEQLAEALGADVGEGHGLIGLDIGGARAEFFEDEMMPGDEDDDEEEYEADVAYEPEVEEDDEAAARWGFDFIPPPPQSARGTRHERALLDMFNQMSDLQHRTQTINHTLGLHRGGRNHHHHHQRRAEEGGSHPLLQRNDNGPARRDADHMPPVIVGGQDIFGQGGHVHDIMWAINQHAHNHEGVSRLTVTMGPNGEVQPSFGRRFSRFLDVDPSHHWREQIPMPFVQTRQRQTDEAQAVDFKPAFTFIRWQEEAQILYGGKAAEKATRIFHTLLSILLPPAMEDKRLKDIVEAEQKAEEKAREDQRKAEAEKAEREAKEKIEREEREAAEAEAAARARSEAEHNPQSDPDTQMTGADDAAPNTEAAAPSTAEAAPTERVTTTIRGREVDITNLGIDPAYLQALPEEFREEVIMGQFHEQRTQAQESGEAPNEISREFLEALPADLQQELLRQEAQERRRRERAAENERRAAERSNAQAPAQAQDMETIDFLATLDPITRQQILMDVREDPSYMNSLPEEVQQEALALFGERRGERAIFGGRFDDAEGARSLGARMREQLRDNPTERPRAKPVVQMLDKAGVATLLRLMFVSLSYKPKNSLHSILSHVCKNTQNRAEVISILLSILQDGTTDVGAVERSFAHLSLRAKQNGAPKTPQPLKRTPTGQVIQPVTELSPLNIVQHCLGTLTSLATDNPKVQTFFLSEHETVSSQKGKGAKKLKSKENKATKYPLNALLTLLDRKLITDNTGVMETLASLLSRVTLPLQILLKRAKEAQDAQDAETAAKAEAADTENAGVDQGDVMETSVADVRMAEAATVGAGTEPDGEKDEDTEEAGEKKKRSTRELEPPNVPEENIRLVVNILAARECPSKTFSDTLDIIKHMAAIPGAREVFGRELIRQAQELGISVATDLVDLAKHINGASSGTDIQGMALASFSSSGSKQRKLLRILVALDHLFDPKRLQALPRSSLAGDSKLKEDILATLYESQTFQSLWNTLSSCLTAIRERGDMVNVATILLPLIESLMVVCRNSALKDAPLGASQTEVSASTPPPETRMEELFFRFTEEHRKILNELIRNNPKLMNGNLSILAKNSKVLEFDNKRSYFNRKLHNKGSDVRVAHPTLTLNVRRETVFIDSYKMLYYKSGEEIKNGKLNIRFTGEEGIDAGGVSREWFAVMARQMFDGHYALFVPVASDRTTFHPNPTSSINEQHLSYFKFIGRVIGKALYEGRVLDCHFTRAVYRRILGKSVSLKDMETLDLDYYKSLVWILENDITDITFETFSVEVDNFGSKDTIDLVPDGRNIAVTEDNKQEYVRLLVEHRLIKSVQEQLESFLGGFFDVIPSELVSIFNEQELELLISGLPDIDVDDWKNNTDYHNYQANSPQIQWFWRAVKSFDPEERAKLLQFVTGTSKVPLNGFKELEGMNGFAKFNIHRDYGSKEKLPTSHTCFNQLDLPEYESYEHLRQQLYTAITAGSEYFGFA